MSTALKPPGAIELGAYGDHGGGVQEGYGAAFYAPPPPQHHNNMQYYANPPPTLPWDFNPPLVSQHSSLPDDTELTKDYKATIFDCVGKEHDITIPARRNEDTLGIGETYEDPHGYQEHGDEDGDYDGGAEDGAEDGDEDGGDGDGDYEGGDYEGGADGASDINDRRGIVVGCSSKELTCAGQSLFWP